ncbi:hypothetical protein BGW38_005929, partial [Lunasporangiospora selenospora]
GANAGGGGDGGNGSNGNQPPHGQPSAVPPSASPAATSTAAAPPAPVVTGLPGVNSGTVIGPGGVIAPPPPRTNSTAPGSNIISGPSIIDPRRPVSRISMIQPKQNAANPPLFPVGSNIVFEWAFDNNTLVFPPTNLSIEVSLSANPKMVWPIANVSGSATSIVWNTGTARDPSLFMGFYTL